MFGSQTFISLYRNHVTEVVSKRLSTYIGSNKSMYRINSSLFPIALYGNDRKQLHLFYARHGETLRDLKYSFKDCHGNCMHRRKCVVSKCMENCTISRQEIDEKYLIYSAQKQGKKMNYTILIFWFQF